MRPPALERALSLSLSLSLALSLSLPVAAQDGLFSRTPLARTITALTSPEATTRRQAAERLALTGPHQSVAAPLTTAIEHEAVPEVLAAMVAALARRAEESDLPALEAAWERASATERRGILAALDAIGAEAALVSLRRHLASEGAWARACAAFTRSDERLRWLASTLDDPAAREHVIACLASADPSEARDAALLRAGLDLEPLRAREVLAALARSPTRNEASIAMAETALARSDATLQPAALALLARHAPERLPIERWQTWLGGDDDRAASALRATLTIAPSLADETLARMRSGSATVARRALRVLLDRESVEDLGRIASFVDVVETRAAALDALASREGGAAVLATLAPAEDALVALALAHPGGEARAALLSRSPSLLVRALVSDVDSSDCMARAESVEARRESALCLAIVGGSERAARALETEREDSVVGWLALAAADAPITSAAIEALFDEDATRAAAIALVPATLRAVSPAEHRALQARLVRATTDADEVTRAEAVRALGRVARATHRGAVLRALEDPSAAVRLAAAMALDGVGIDRSDVRVVGRTHVEPDAHVLAALRDEPLAIAAAPLHVRVIEDGPGSSPRVVVFLPDGRALRLAPIGGEIVVIGVPDAEAIVRLE